MCNSDGFGFSTTAEEVVGGRDLTGKRALVTGGNSGIGKETARVLSKAGCRVWITSRRMEAGQEAVREIEESHKSS